VCSIVLSPPRRHRASWTRAGKAGPPGAEVAAEATGIDVHLLFSHRIRGIKAYIWCEPARPGRGG
jgi:hypothetical protein